MAQIPKHRQLPNKEQTLFKELLTQYELKQYKKGIKAADSILKKFPNHGETLALKALTLHSSLPYPPTVSSAPKTEEAEAMAKLAVKKDITSHITWHVMGILAKTRKDWDEASKAFAMARKQDNDNIPLIRDCIALFAHTRQYGQAVAARHHHLLLRPQIRSSWLGLVVAHHLNGNPTEAIEVYDAYASTIAKDGASGPEKAQILQYVVKLCIDANMLDDGLRRLEAGLQSRVLSPRGEVTQLKAELLVKLGRLEDAEEVYRSLLDQNPDNLEYYRGYLRTKGYDLSAPLDDETLGKVTAVLDSFVEVFPRSAAPRRLPLDLTSGEVFRERAKKYLISGLEKGVPSLFVDVKGVYVDAKRMEIVGEILEETISQLEKDASLHDDDTIAPPTTLLWAYYFHALHLSHPSHPNPSHSRSLELLDKALVHTPTLPELYMAKAMVLKRAGDALGAAQAMEEARLLDGQDRFLNGKAAKYWLRAGEVKRAEELVAMFTKKDSPPVTDLTDLQCLWFLEEEARAYRRNGNLGLALKRYHALISTFQEYEDDQYDFHTYSMRRMTFNAYIDLMKFEDQLRSHPSYFKAAIEASEIYVQISDDPSLTEVKLTPEEEAEKKKAAKKAQKAEQKAKKAALANSDGKKEDPPVPDEDPEGLQLLKSETPLDDALKAWKPLEKLAARRVETWTTGYEIFIRKKLVLAALKCLLAAYEIEPENAKLHSQIINFKRTVDAEQELAEPVKAVIESQFSSLLPSSTTLEEFNKAFGAKHAQSPSHILGAAQGVYEIKKSDPQSSDAADAVLAILDGLTKDGVPPSVSVFERSILLLKQAGASGETVNEFRQKALRRAPLAKILEGDDVRKRKRDEAMAVNEETNGTAKTDV